MAGSGAVRRFVTDLWLKYNSLWLCRDYGGVLAEESGSRTHPGPHGGPNRL